MVHQRILLAIYADAWHEKIYQAPGGQPHVREIRLCRDRRWWEGLRVVPSRLREERHSAPGQVCEWEDPFILAYGLDWRSVRDSHPNKFAWLSQSTNFVDTICKEWGLPTVNRPAVMVGDSARSESQPPKRLKTDILLTDRPLSHDSPKASSLQLDWAALQDCFIFVVDCKPLADVINGHTKLQCDELRDTVEKMVSKLGDIVECNWLPSGLWTDPVRWAPRKHNIVADYLCNCSMDYQKSLHETFSVVMPRNFNIIVHSDGGARTTCASAAWVAEITSWQAETREWQVQTLAYSATYINSWVSSFTAETMALYQAVDFVSSFISKLRS